jgi:hypothetical protein
MWGSVEGEKGEEGGTATEVGAEWQRVTREAAAS